MILYLVRCVSIDFTSGSYVRDDGGTAESVRVERDEKRDFGLPSCMMSRRVCKHAPVEGEDDGEYAMAASVI